MGLSAIRNPRPRLLGALALGCAIGAVTAGCSKPRTAHVYGTVFQADGKPLPGGTVVFYPTEGKTLHSSAEISADGTYDMPKAPTGTVKITVANLYLKEGTPPPVGGGGGAPAGAKMPKGFPGGPPKGVNMGPPKGIDMSKSPGGKGGTAAAPDRYVPIDEKFTKPETSGLTVEVKPGKQKHDITLK